MTSVLLQELGYWMRKAGSDEAALSVLAQRAGIDILLTSLTIPGWTGSQLASAVKSQQPELLVIFLSDYTSPMDQKAMAGQRFIRKPCGAAELSGYRGSLAGPAARLSGQ